MHIELPLPWAVCVALLSLRLTVALALTPALSTFGVPASFRVVLTLALAALTMAYHELPPAAARWAESPEWLLAPAFAEVLSGVLLGLTVHIVLAALALAGRLLDVQTGFAIGSVFDPVTRASSNVLGSMAVLLGVVLFVVSDAHLQLVQLISRSIDLLPLGAIPTLNDPMRPLLAAGELFTLGLSLAAPVTIALLMTDLAIGVASRNMPQMNVFMLAVPVKIIIGYSTLAFAVIGWAPLLQRSFGRVASAVGVN